MSTAAEEKPKTNVAPPQLKSAGARPQTVTSASNPLFHTLLRRFHHITGVPMVLNTSFNENEPVVCRPHEALDDLPPIAGFVPGPDIVEQLKSGAELDGTRADKTELLRHALDATAAAGTTEIMFQPCGPDVDRELRAFMAMASA